MLHSDALKLLFPLELVGVYEQDIELEGIHLDKSESDAQELLAEMFPDGANELLPDWERVCGLVPAADEPLQARRNAVLRQLRSRGGLSRAYFIALAANMGFTITIQELQPFMAGIGSSGDIVYLPRVIFIWQISTPGRSPAYSFISGQSASGERLLWWSVTYQPALETIFQKLKPAHTAVIFNYT